MNEHAEPLLPAAPSGVGAYGFRLLGLDSVAEQLVQAPASWPSITVGRAVDGTLTSTEDAFSLSHDAAELHTIDPRGQPVILSLRRDPLEASLLCPGGLSSHAIVHPYLSLTAAIAHRWHGTNAFHAGAFTVDGGAWAVLGSREAGKSTLLAHLMTRGAGIVADDLVAVRRGQVSAGPRTIDLRPGAAEHLGRGRCLDADGMPGRWRVAVPPVAAQIPLRGWIVPEWGDELELTPVAAIDRLPLLCANLFLARVPTHPEQLLESAALPCVRFRRPRQWDTMEKASEVLLRHLEHHG